MTFWRDLLAKRCKQGGETSCREVDAAYGDQGAVTLDLQPRSRISAKCGTFLHPTSPDKQTLVLALVAMM